MKRIASILTVFIAAGAMSLSANAKTAPKKPTAAETLQNGKDAYYNYEFDDALDFFDEYRTLQKKAKKPLDEELETLEKKAKIASGAFDRVQKIVVVDSISMPRASFYKAFKLSESAGDVARDSEFQLPGLAPNNEVSFLNESRDYLITSIPDEDENMQLIESRKLLDGTWETMETLTGDFEKTGDYSFPFLSGDGQTLYFANNGEESMGGYDLFVAQKDPISGESLQPLNLGMPFNSPYDDLMIAIDEEAGLGWWATDRNDPGGDITVYVYILDEVRKNYPSDTEDLVDFAKITQYQSTWEEGKEEYYKKIRNSISK